MSQHAVMPSSGVAASPTLDRGTQPRLTDTEVANLIRCYAAGAPGTWGILLSKTAGVAKQKDALASLLSLLLKTVQNTRAQLPILLAWTLNRGLAQEDLQTFMQTITKITEVKDVDDAAWYRKQLSVRTINSQWGDDWHLQLGSKVWDTLGHGSSNPYTLLTAVLEGLARASQDYGMDLIEEVIQAACIRLQDGFKIKVGPQDIQVAIAGRIKPAIVAPVKSTPVKSAALCAPAIRSASQPRTNKPSLVKPGLPKPRLAKPRLAKPSPSRPSLAKPTTTNATKISPTGDQHTAEPAATHAGKPQRATAATRQVHAQAGATQRSTPAGAASRSSARPVDAVNVDEAETLIADMIRAVDKAHARLKPVMGKLAADWDSKIPLDAVLDRVAGRIHDLRGPIRAKRLRDGAMGDAGPAGEGEGEGGESVAERPRKMRRLLKTWQVRPGPRSG